MLFKRIILSSLLMLLFAALHAQVKHKAKPKPPGIAASIDKGKDVYMQTCVTCHQVDGGGVQNMNPPLIKTTYCIERF